MSHVLCVMKKQKINRYLKHSQRGSFTALPGLAWVFFPLSLKRERGGVRVGWWRGMCQSDRLHSLSSPHPIPLTKGERDVLLLLPTAKPEEPLLLSMTHDTILITSLGEGIICGVGKTT